MKLLVPELPAGQTEVVAAAELRAQVVAKQKAAAREAHLVAAKNVEIVERAARDAAEARYQQTIVAKVRPCWHVSMVCLRCSFLCLVAERMFRCCIWLCLVYNKRRLLVGTPSGRCMTSSSCSIHDAMMVHVADCPAEPGGCDSADTGGADGRTQGGQSCGAAAGQQMCDTLGALLTGCVCFVSA